MDIFIIFGCSQVQQHPIWHFLEPDDFIAICCTCKKIYQNIDDETIAFYTMPSKYRNSYLRVCPRGIIPNINNLMDMSTMKNDVLKFTIKKGHTNVVDWLLSNFRFNINPVDIATQYGKYDMLQLLYLNKIGKFTSHVVDMACACGQFNILLWLYTIIPECFSQNSIFFASREGHYNVVEWLLNNAPIKYSQTSMTKAFDGASGNGHLEIMKLLHELDIQCTTKAMDSACANGHLNAAQWLNIHRKEGYTTDAMTYAVHNGHFEIVQWLNEIGAKCRESALGAAGAKGHFEIVKWLCNNVPSCSTRFALEIGAMSSLSKHPEISNWIKNYAKDLNIYV